MTEGKNEQVGKKSVDIGWAVNRLGKRALISDGQYEQVGQKSVDIGWAV